MKGETRTRAWTKKGVSEDPLIRAGSGAVTGNGRKVPEYDPGMMSAILYNIS